MQATRDRVRTLAADGRYELHHQIRRQSRPRTTPSPPGRKTADLADHHFLSAPISNNVRCENGKYKSATATAIANPNSFGALFLMGGLAASGYVDWRIATGLLVAFLLLSIESYLPSYTLGIFRLSFAKFGPTEIRLLLGIANAVLFFLPAARIPGWSHRLLDIGGAIAIAAMTAMAIFAAVTHTLSLYHQETL
jgi:hypothetical protein